MAVLRTRVAVVVLAPVLILVTATTSGATPAGDAPSGGPAAVVDSPPIAAAPSPWPVAPMPSARAGWAWPVAGPPQVRAVFAPGPSRWSPGHRGVDLAASQGATVRSAGAGRVGFSGRVAGRGVVTVLHAGGLRTTYEPVGAGPPVGSPVSAGTPIGRLERLGSHCAAQPCLHWGLLRGRVYLDPLGLVRRPDPPILLPLLR